MSKKRIDMMTACAERGPLPLLVVVVVDEEDEDPDDVATGTMLVTDAVPDCETMEVVTLELPEEPVDAADSAEVVGEEPPALLLLLALLPDDATNGFAELPPVPCVRSMVIVPMVSCCERFSLRSVESMEEPVLIAQIQLLLLSVGVMLPPDHELQPSQRMLAVIDPSELELEPLSTVIEVAELESYVG